MLMHVLLVVHLVLALGLVVLILMQQSEGGVLGMGGGGNGMFTARGASNILSRMTAILGTGFFITSLTLTLLAGAARPKSVADQIDGAPAAALVPLAPATAPVAPAVPAPQAPATQAPAAQALPDLAADTTMPEAPKAD